MRCKIEQNNTKEKEKVIKVLVLPLIVIRSRKYFTSRKRCGCDRY